MIEDRTPGDQPSIPMTWWRSITGILLVCILARLFVGTLGRESPADPLKTLGADLPPVRLTEGLLSGQAYAPYPTLPDKRHQPILRLRQASMSLRDRSSYHLLVGDLDRAITDIEEALRTAPHQASLLSDLSALYGERAKTKNQPEDYVSSLEMTERAADLQPSILNASTNFNHALALEHLFLRDTALHFWRQCQLCGNGEAAQHTKKLLAEQRASVRRLRPQALQQVMLHKKNASVQDAAEERMEAEWQLELARRARRNDDLNSEASALRAAESLFRLLAENGRIPVVQSRIADVLGLLGQPSEAWSYRIQALAWTNRLPPYPLLSRADPKEIQIALAVLEGAVQASLKQRCPMAALRFQGRTLALALALKARDRIALSWLSLARIEAALGKQENARQNFSSALGFLPAQPSNTTKALAALIDTVRSEIEDAEGRAAAIASDRLPSARLDQQANFDLRRGDTAAGERALERALEALERQRLKVPSGSGRVSYFDQARPLYQRLAALETHLLKPEKALDVLERFRARFLLDQMGELPTDGAPPIPLTGTELIRRLPEHTALVVYAAIDDRLVTLLVRPSGVWMSPIQSEMPMVASWVRRLLEPQVGEVGRGQLLEELHETLVAPWIGQLAADDRIIFIPTSDFYRLPFAALRDEKSGRFLIEDHPVGVAPSASQFIAAVERDRQRSAKPAHKVLLVGNPSLSSTDMSSALPGSAQEIETLSRLYSDRETEVLTRGKATSRRVLGSLRQAEIIHLSTHSIGDTKDPLRSRLLLSAAEGDPGEISARDLHRVRLPKTRLVILASCGSQAGPVSASEGSLSLAYSFLAAGVPAVVGSLWLVDDGDTARISIRFHEELLRGADALTALRAAQREEIAVGKPLADWTWASFQVYGGVGERIPARLTPEG